MFPTYTSHARLTVLDRGATSFPYSAVLACLGSVVISKRQFGAGVYVGGVHGNRYGWSLVACTIYLHMVARLRQLIG